MKSNNESKDELIDSAEHNESTVIKKSFLYIGQALVKTKKCIPLFRESYISKDYTEAKDFLSSEEQKGDNFPSLIIIDIPYNKAALLDFTSWVKQNYSATVPVIYNESSVPMNQIKQLTNLKLVDDVVKIEAYCNRLHEKAVFLQKTKSYLRKPLSLEELQARYQDDKHSAPVMPFSKRLFDIVVSSIAILFFLPLFVLIAIAIRLESKGAVVYSSYRAGRGFKIFKFYKFRTMVQNADKQVSDLAKLNMYESNEVSAFFKVKNDPRITKVGSFLRNTSLDELPQLFNVLLGDMSIVGNRPLPLYEAAVLTTDQWSERFMAPAGITGLWQVSKRGQDQMSAEERLELDINYARNSNFKTDFWIMLQTPTALFQKSNV